MGRRNNMYPASACERHLSRFLTSLNARSTRSRYTGVLREFHTWHIADTPPTPTPEPSPTPTLPPGMVTCSTVIETLNDSATVCDTTGCQIVLGGIPNAGSVEMYGRSADSLWYKLRGIGWLADETPASVDGWVAAEELALVDALGQSLGCLDGLALMDDTGATLTPTPVPSGVCTSRPLNSETGAYIRPTPGFGAGTPLIKYGGTLMLAGVYDQDGEWLRVEGYTDPGGTFDGTVVGWAHASMFGGVEPCGDGNAVDNLPIVDGNGEVIGDPPTPQPTATPLPPPPTPAFGVGCRVYTAAPAYIRFGPYTYGDATVPLYMIEQGVWVDLYSKTVNGETVNGIPNWYNVGYPSSENPLYYGWMHELLLDANLLQSDCAELPVVGSALPPTPVPPTPTPTPTLPPDLSNEFLLPMRSETADGTPLPNHPPRLTEYGCYFGGAIIGSRDINLLSISGQNHPLIVPAPATVDVVDTSLELYSDEYKNNNAGLGWFVAIRIDMSDIPESIKNRLASNNQPFNNLASSYYGFGTIDTSRGALHIAYSHLLAGSIPEDVVPGARLPAGSLVGLSGRTGGYDSEGILNENNEHLDVSMFYVPSINAPSSAGFLGLSNDHGGHFSVFKRSDIFGDAIMINPLTLWPILQADTNCPYDGQPFWQVFSDSLIVR